MRVLIAEDSTDNQLLIKYYLKGTEIDPTFANNGNEAVQKAQSETFDAILMDIQMPEVDGYEATARLRKWGFKKPIIALTAHTLKEERDKALNSGFTDFVSKPISRDHLLHALRSCRVSLVPLVSTIN